MANDMFNSVIGGGLQGAGAGAQFGPIGIGVGAGLGILGGFLQGQQQRKNMAAYNKAEAAINPVDPAQTALLGRLRQQEKAYRAGSDPSSAWAMQNQQNALAQTQNNINRMGGGSVSQLLRSQQNANLGAAQIGAQAAARADQLIPLQANITNVLAERQYQRQQQIRATALARAEQGRQDIFNTLASGIALIPQISGAGGGAAKVSGAKGPIFDPLAATSPGVGTYFPGAIDAADMLPPTRMQPRYLWQ